MPPAGFANADPEVFGQRARVRSMTPKRLPAVLQDDAESRARIRLAEQRDRENLRIWKNRNKRWFFHQQDITPAQQAAWFEGYLVRPDDHQYLVEELVNEVWSAVGVVAIRRDGEALDVYNVMRGEPGNGIASIGRALRLLCNAAIAAYQLPITCRVLAENPAEGWYRRLGFVVEHTNPTFNVLRYTQ